MRGACRAELSHLTLCRVVLAAILDEMLARKIPDSSVAFWACLVRAFPDAATDARQYEKALTNVALVYGAGSETTAGSIAMTLAALAADPDSMAKVEQVCTKMHTIAQMGSDCARVEQI